MRAAYAEAIRERYRFYSFGDAMLVVVAATLPGVSAPPPGTFELEATDGAARAGVLWTAHGPVRTPVFMPVGTKATVKALDPRSWRRSARRSCSATRTTCTCGPARS